MAKPIAALTLFNLRDFCKTQPELVETLKKVKDIGFKTVQISGVGPHDPNEVGNVLKDMGMNCCITHMGWNRFQEDLDGVIADHKAYDCPHTAIGSIPDEYRTAEGLNRFIDELAPISEKLAAEGLDFNYHNHHFEFIHIGEGKTWLGELYARTSPEMLKSELDVHWVARGGCDPAQWVRDLAGRIPVLHFKDFAVVGGESNWGEVRFAPIGEGNLNWPAIIDAAEAGGCDYAVVEQDNCYDEDPFDCMTRSFKNMMTLGLRVE